MSREEVIAKLKELHGYGDPEYHHQAADVLLCAFLRELGYGDIVDEYHKIEKWYA